MIQAILLHALVVEPGAIAPLPLEPANHAELRPATARHVVASFLQFHSRGTVVAALPALLLCNLDEFSVRGGRSGAGGCGMPFPVAGGADAGLATAAASHFSIFFSLAAAALHNLHL